MSSFLSSRKKRVLLKILSWFSTASLLLTFVILPVQPLVHADIVAYRDYGAAGMITGYGAWNGTSLAFDVFDDISNGVVHAGELIEGLWNQAYVELGTLPTYSSMEAYYASGVISQYQVYGSPYSQIIITEETARALDSFWDWLLTEVGLERNAQGNFEFPSDFVPVTVESDTFVDVPDLVLYGPISSGWTYQTSNNVTITVSNISGGELYVYYYRSTTENQDIYPVFVSPSSATRYRIGNPYYTTDGYSGGEQKYYGDDSYLSFSPPLYWIRSSGGWPVIGNVAVSYTANTESPIPANVISDSSSQATVSVSVTGPSSRTGKILLPDPSDPDYDPQPVTIPTVIPYPPEFAPLPVPVPDPITGDFPENAPDPEDVAEALAQPLVQGAIDGELVAENPELNPDPEPGPDPDAPVEVITPFLPVVFPSFNFSLSGIWHYVVEWVGTLGSWFSMVFTIWSHLPYAIVVPVYATAVVVIVLGVYKRFFM